MSQPFPRRRPLLFAGLLVLLVLGVFLITYAVKAIWHGHSIVITVLAEGVLGLAAVLLLSRLRWWRVAGFRTPRYSPALFCLLAPCLS